MVPAPPPPPPARSIASPAVPPPPPRVASPAGSSSVSRPSSPNFLSQSTRGRPAVPSTLNLSALVADLDTLRSNPNVLCRPEFTQPREPRDAYAPPKPARKSLAEIISKERQLPPGTTKEEAAEFAQEWLDATRDVIVKVDSVFNERPGHGQRARMDRLDEWTGRVERGMGDE